MSFTPDYHHIIDAAMNRTARRLPLYEHCISMGVVEALTGENCLEPVYTADAVHAEKVEGFRTLCEFYREYGYDVIAFEYCLNAHVQKGEALMGHGTSIISSVDDVMNYDWDGLYHNYIKAADPKFKALSEALPPGMKAVGGVGNGVFETIQDFTTFTGLCMLQYDNPEAYTLLWQKIGDTQIKLWQWFMNNHAHAYAVCRFGDDLGFHSSTLLQPDEIKKHILPQYKRIVDLVHSFNKPFLLHSCGKIYDVMDELIDYVGIDAKHSNEDSIDTFDVWLGRYGDRIGNFGGVEMNILCLNTPVEVKEYVTNICRMSEGKGGVAIGSGNQIASYVKPECFIAMTEAVREYRNEN